MEKAREIKKKKKRPGVNEIYFPGEKSQQKRNINKNSEYVDILQPVIENIKKIAIRAIRPFKEVFQIWTLSGGVFAGMPSSNHASIQDIGQFRWFWRGNLAVEGSSA